MTCKDLLKQYTDALERDELDWEALRKLAQKCGGYFALEAVKATARKAVQFAVTRGWALFRGSKIAGRDVSAAYGRAVEMIWQSFNWFEMGCGPLADVAAYIAEAVAKHSWPKWPFLALPAVA
ncbi:MAG: hypothetical protein JHC22_07845, partial [Thermoproteus sp.]|nr:hypothetical protein [Thermoproteus sp.]